MLEALPWIVVVMALVAVPTGIVLCHKRVSRWVALSVIVYLINAVFAAWYLAPWDYWSYWLYLVFCAIAVIGVVACLIKMRNAGWRRPNWAGFVGAVLTLVGGAYLMMQNVLATAARTEPSNAIDLQSPLRNGTFKVVQGGTAPPLQTGHAGVPSQRYAVDLVKLNSSLRITSPYLDTQNFESHAIWEEPVYSPCDGAVVWSRDGIEDTSELDLKRPAGNVVGIDCQGVTVMLAHLREGSVAVQQGDSVAVGQLLGTIGMSGRTFGPHLHMHAEQGPLKQDFSDNAPVAFTLDGRFPYTGLIMAIPEKTVN
ncbi:MAG: M23 family metallopeptidase [Pseudomonadota bacterium]